MSTGGVEDLDHHRKRREAVSNGDGLGERVARIEATLPHLATKEDVAKLETRIVEKLDAQTKWLIGIVSIGLITIVAALIRTFL